ARDLYLGKALETPQPAIWWQVTRLAFAGFGAHLAQLRRATADLLYAAWWWTVIGLTFVAGWSTVMLLPRLTWRSAAIRTLARGAFKMLGVPLSVEGLDRLPSASAVIAFNHSSYMDVLTVAAVLPGAPTYVAKKELAEQIFAGPLLRRLGVLFLD